MKRSGAKPRGPPKKQNSRSTFSTFNEIQKLGVTELNEQCMQFSINPTLPRRAKVHLVTLACGLSTCEGSVNVVARHNQHLLKEDELEKLQSFNTYNMYMMTGWSNDLSKLPPINSVLATEYLLRSDVIDQDQSRAYKLCRPYKMMEFVHSLAITEGCGRFSILQAQVNPSQSTSRDDVKLCFLILDSSLGVPFGGSCSCTAGQSGACAHLGALMFVASEIVSNGMTELPETGSCTDRPCAWVQHKDSHVDPVLLNQLTISSSSRCQQRHALSTLENTVDDDTWQLAVSDMYHHLSKAADPPVGLSYLHPDRFDSDTGHHRTHATLPLSASDHHPGLVHSLEVEVKNEPPTLIDLMHGEPVATGDDTFSSICDDYMCRLQKEFPDTVCDEIEYLTRGQWLNEKWYSYKTASIGSSKLNAVRRVLNGGKADSVVSDLMGYHRKLRIPSPSSLSPRDPRSYGLMNEAKAKEQYCKIYSVNHQNLRVQDVGLVINRQRPFFRVSPDGFITCDCHPRRVIEIKCPWTLRDGTTIKQAVDTKKMPYLSLDGNDNYELVPCKSSGYYEQVQAMMGVTGTSTCDFVIWSPTENLVITVALNEKYYSDILLPNVDAFFKKYLLVEIVSQRIKHKLGSQGKKLYLCYYCSGSLKEVENVKTSKDNSVGCSCSKCECDNWAHWKCANYTSSKSDQDIDWLCFSCTRH